VNCDGNTPLHHFCSKFKNPSFEELFNLFIKKGADVNLKNAGGETPLHKVCFFKKITIISNNFQKKYE